MGAEAGAVLEATAADRTRTFTATRALPPPVVRSNERPTFAPSFDTKGKEPALALQLLATFHAKGGFDRQRDDAADKLARAADADLAAVRRALACAKLEGVDASHAAVRAAEERIHQEEQRAAARREAARQAAATEAARQAVAAEAARQEAARRAAAAARKAAKEAAARQKAARQEVAAAERRRQEEARAQREAAEKAAREKAEREAAERAAAEAAAAEAARQTAVVFEVDLPGVPPISQSIRSGESLFVRRAGPDPAGTQATHELSLRSPAGTKLCEGLSRSGSLLLTASESTPCTVEVEVFKNTWVIGDEECKAGARRQLSRNTPLLFPKAKDQDERVAGRLQFPGAPPPAAPPLPPPAAPAPPRRNAGGKRRRGAGGPSKPAGAALPSSFNADDYAPDFQNSQEERDFYSSAMCE